MNGRPGWPSRFGGGALRRGDIPVGWARWGLGSWLLSHLYPVSGRPILVVSLPRSGSSWVGKSLGQAPNALYLREPITQSAIGGGLSDRAIVDHDPAAIPRSYSRFADAAFAAYPAFRAGIVAKPDQWRLSTRRARRLVIKEVNPLALEWLLPRYRPQVVFLVRHPVAVARSYQRLGWTGSDVGELFGPASRLGSGVLGRWRQALDREGDYWFEQGKRQGAVLYCAWRVLQRCRQVEVVEYETLCRRPRETFQALSHKVGLVWDGSMESALERSTGGDDSADPYGTRRPSAQMGDAWRGAVPEACVARLRDGFSQFGLPWYQDDTDW